MIKEDSFIIDVSKCDYKTKEKIQKILFKNGICWLGQIQKITLHEWHKFYHIVDKILYWNQEKDEYLEKIKIKIFTKQEFLNRYDLDSKIKLLNKYL